MGVDWSEGGVEGPGATSHIEVRGARTHNLQGIEVDVPRDRLVVLTGVSGSGKSSLAFDTIFAEGRRRYLEGLSVNARLFLDRVDRPDVDTIDGLPPTVAVDQKTGAANPRSTLATITEIHDALRALYARAGLPHCPRCGTAIQRLAPEQIVGQVLGLEAGTKVIVMAPLVRGRKGQHAEAFDAVRRAGLVRARVDGQMVEVQDAPKLAKTKAHDIEAVVDRLVVREGLRPRLAESVDRAVALGEGTVVLSVANATGGWDDRVLSTRFGCPSCGGGLAELEPRTFSFNSPYGACPSCEGLGCATCAFTRLRPEARAVTLGGRSIAAVLADNVVELGRWLDGLEWRPPLDLVGPPLAATIRNRLRYLERVGLGYLTLDRATDSLSGGELQRARLAAQVGSGLVGVAFVLDEPTAGLHPRDTERLLDCLRELRDTGNSVLIVEHDEAMMRAADWIIDLGPGAGPYGGRVVAAGPPQDLKGEESLTARYLSAGSEGPRTRSAAIDSTCEFITIHNPRAHNLKGGAARFPTGALTCVTGVSGSGKSSLVLDILAPAATRAVHGAGPEPDQHDGVEGLESIRRVIVVDQAPIGRTPRSTPSTYVGTFDELRRVFAQVREARARGYKPSRFAFNARGGRCEACRGHGSKRLTMRFLPDLFVVCEACAGKRYNAATLEVRFKGKSIADVLEMRVDEALACFAAVPRIRRGLRALQEAGLGYLALGQSSTTLSGGEAQRVKLAAELARETSDPTLFLFDEPTTGLHFADVARLLEVFERLRGLGHTLVVIEHNPDVIRSADWVVDLGPEGGPEGGHIVAQGPVKAIAEAPDSVTGRYLASR